MFCIKYYLLENLHYNGIISSLLYILLFEDIYIKNITYIAWKFKESPISINSKNTLIK